MSESVDNMTIMPLGGGQEVGRSCILLEFKGRSLLLDCGAHPGIEGNGSLPFFDSLEDPSTIDMILITHFHIDHCASLPYFTEKTDFRGKIFMTHATKAVMKLLLNDNIKLQVKQKPLYSEAELESCIDKIDVIDYYETKEYKGIKFTATKAGHVLGACMFTIEIDGVRVLYTGDYSMEEDRHLPQADIPDGPSPDVLIVESTFGTTTLTSREEREDKFIRTVEAVVSRRGSCLIPVFALGRAQELLLILEDLWRHSPKLQSIPIYYASKLANKALKIYETFINMMNKGLQTAMDVDGNPFALQHITRVPMNNDFDQIIGSGPCVVMASPGFLQSGVSRYLFERWCDDPKSGVILAGYTVEGTLAHSLLSLPSEITCLDNRKKAVKCLIEHISFSAHVDFNGNLKFIKAVNPGNIVLVHGEKSQMMKLKHRLDVEIRSVGWSGEGKKPAVVTPHNGQPVILRFQRRLVADVLGDAAVDILAALSSTSSNAPTPVDLPTDSLLVTENFQSKIVVRKDLQTFTECRPVRISQKVFVSVSQDLLSYAKGGFGGVDTSKSLGYTLLGYVKPFLEDIFDDVLFETENSTILIQKMVKISADSGQIFVVEWMASPVADFVADSAAGALLQSMSTAAVLRSSLTLSTKMSSLEPLVPKRKPSMTAIKDEKRSRLTGLNPSVALPQDIQSEKARLERLITLMKDRNLLSNFSEVKLTLDAKKLIFRSNDPEHREAFCVISFSDDKSDEHEAVVSSDDDEFKRLVIDSLQSLK